MQIYQVKLIVSVSKLCVESYEEGREGEMTSSCPIPLGQMVGPITVGLVERSDRVWICENDPCDKLMDELYSAAENLVRMEPARVKVGVLGATIFSEDQGLYRAEVLEIIKADEVLVRFIDYGNCEAVKIDSLMSLPVKLEEAVKLAVPVSVKGVDPNTVGNSEKNRAKIMKKLQKETLMVKLSEVNGSLIASFFAGGKEIRFCKSKESVPEANLSPPEESKPTPIETAAKVVVEEIKDEKVAAEDSIPAEVTEKAFEGTKSMKIFKSGTGVTMVSQLPALKLLEDVEISGFVQHVSPIGSVWFSPGWIQESVDSMHEKLGLLDEEGKMISVVQADLCPGMLCVARHLEYHTLFRARLLSLDGTEVSVKYIDYGDGEKVPLTNLYNFPPGLDMMAPAAAEIVLARSPPKDNPEKVLKELLMADEAEIVLKLETEESTAKVGRFYRDGKEVKWDDLIETPSVFSTKERDKQMEDDVVVETEEVIEPENKQEEVTATESKLKAETIVEETKPETAVSKPAAEEIMTKRVQEKRPTKEVPKVSKQELIKMVPPAPLDEQETPVYVTHVESVERVWVCRTEDEKAIRNLMDDLNHQPDFLAPAPRKKPGAVYAARYAADGQLYRAVLKDRAGPAKVSIQFIDFGNYDTIPMDSLRTLPEHLARISAFATPVQLSTGLEETPENLDLIHSALEAEGEVNLTVSMVQGKGQFKVDGARVVFGEKETTDQVVETEQDEISAAEPEVVQEEEIVLAEGGGQSQAVERDQDQISPTEPEQGEKLGDAQVIEESGVSTEGVKKVNPEIQGTENNEKIMNSGPEEVEKATDDPAQLTSAEADGNQEEVNKNVLIKNTEVSSRSFSRAISGLKPKELAKKKLPWLEGVVVLAKYPDGSWVEARVVDCQESGVWVWDSAQKKPFLIDHADVKPACLPVDALNMIEKDINLNVLEAGIDGVADTQMKNAVKSVKLLNNILRPETDSGEGQKRERGVTGLPAEREIARYSTTEAGSRHLQSVISERDTIRNK